MAFPFGPRFTAVYDDDFAADRGELGLSGANFDHFFEDVERQLLDYPWIFSREVPDSGGTLMRETRNAFPDIPPLYVYYKVIQDSPRDCRVYFLGLSPAWSKEDLAPPPFPEPE